MRRNLRRRVRFLKYAYALSALTFVFMAGAAFRLARGGTTRFSEVTVERIHVVDANGTVRMIVTKQGSLSANGHCRGAASSTAGRPRGGLVVLQRRRCPERRTDLYRTPSERVSPRRRAL